MPLMEIPDRFETPPNHLYITRYFTESKFRKLLLSSSLYLGRIDKFPNADEILFSLSDIKFLRETRGDRFDMEMEVYNSEKATSYINCWTFEFKDWRKFWEIYGNSKNALMIKVLVGKLKEELNESEKTIYMPKVLYFDIVNQPLRIFNSIRMLSRKPSDFAWEKEVRILIHHFRPKEPMPDFILIPINLKRVIEEIVISPFSDEGFFEEVRNLLIENGFDSKILKKSEIKLR